MPRIASCFIPNAMTGFVASVFLFPNRVSPWEAFEVLEPDDGKLSRPVLRGLDPSDGVRLLGDNLVRPPCLENPRPERAALTLAENVASPFHAEPRQCRVRL